MDIIIIIEIIDQKILATVFLFIKTQIFTLIQHADLSADLFYCF